MLNLTVVGNAAGNMPGIKMPPKSLRPEQYMAQIVENIKSLKNQRQSTDDLRLAVNSSRNPQGMQGLSFGQSDYDKDMYKSSPKRTRLEPL